MIERRKDLAQVEHERCTKDAYCIANKTDNFELVCDMIEGKVDPNQFNEWTNGGFYSIDHQVKIGNVQNINGVYMINGEVFDNQFS